MRLRQSRGRGVECVVNLFFCPEVWRNEFVLLSLQQNMNYDISESVSQRGSGEETPENRRIYEVADELRKLRKIAESMKSPMNSIDAANYMKRNFEIAKAM